MSVIWGDLALAALLTLFGLYGTGPSAKEPGMPLADATAYTLVVVASVSMVFWRWRPMWTFTLTALALAVYVVLGYPYGPILIVAALAVFGVVTRVEQRRALLAAGAITIASVAASVLRVVNHGGSAWDLFAVGAWVVVPAAIGFAVSIRRRSLEEVRAEQARRMTSEERLRMAQELHDSVGHGLAVIAMQAGVALHVLERNPDKVRASLEAIRDTSRSALDDLRLELRALRTPDEGREPRAPAPGMADARTLLERVRAGGLSLAVHIDDFGTVPPEVDAAAYRILQESLTNVLRHSGARHAEVTVRRRSGALDILVHDDGDGMDAASGQREGTGIPGMRRRAERLGGEFTVTTGPGGGLAVRARLPLGPRTSGRASA